MSFQNFYVNSQDQNKREIVSGCKPQKEHFTSMSFLNLFKQTFVG